MGTAYRDIMHSKSKSKCIFSVDVGVGVETSSGHARLFLIPSISSDLILLLQPILYLYEKDFR